MKLTEKNSDLVPPHELVPREMERGISDTIFKKAGVGKKLGMAPDLDLYPVLICFHYVYGVRVCLNFTMVKTVAPRSSISFCL